MSSSGILLGLNLGFASYTLSEGRRREGLRERVVGYCLASLDGFPEFREGYSCASICDAWHCDSADRDLTGKDGLNIG